MQAPHQYIQLRSPDPSAREEFERITEGLSDALEFTRTIGLGKDIVSYEQGGGRGALGEVDFYTRSVRSYSYA